MAYFKDRPPQIGDIMVQHSAIGTPNENKNLRQGLVMTLKSLAVKVRLADGSEQTWTQGDNCYNLTARMEGMRLKADKLAAKEERLRTKLEASVVKVTSSS